MLLVITLQGFYDYSRLRYNFCFLELVRQLYNFILYRYSYASLMSVWIRIKKLRIQAAI